MSHGIGKEEMQRREYALLALLSDTTYEESARFYLSAQERALICIMRDTQDGRLSIAFENGELISVVRHTEPDGNEEFDI